MFCGLFRFFFVVFGTIGSRYSSFPDGVLLLVVRGFSLLMVVVWGSLLVVFGWPMLCCGLGIDCQRECWFVSRECEVVF